MKNYKRSAIDRDVTFRPPVHNCYACNDTGIVHNSDGLINNYLADYDITESGKRVAGSDLAIICYCEAVYPKYNEEAQLTGHGFRDGEGNIRRYSLVGKTRSYADLQAGTIDYTSGVIKINNINITAISNVDDATSTQIRIIVTPSSNDIVPVRNQILEIDFTNTSVTASADTESSSGSATSTSGSGTTATTTVSTSGGTSSY